MKGFLKMFSNLSLNPAREPALWLAGIVAYLVELHPALVDAGAALEGGDIVGAVLILLGGLFLRGEYTPRLNRQGRSRR